jgi:hypothetical protein
MDMTTRQRIEERIRKKEQEIQEHENHIRDAKIYIEALKETLKMLPRDGVEEESSETKIKPGSKIGKVYELLKHTGRPMHVGDLLLGIGEQNTKENRLSLSGSLGFYVRKNDVFSRPRPNTFGLISSNGQPENEPPADFGLPAQRQINVE